MKWRWTLFVLKSFRYVKVHQLSQSGNNESGRFGSNLPNSNYILLGNIRYLSKTLPFLYMAVKFKRKYIWNASIYVVTLFTISLRCWLNVLVANIFYWHWALFKWKRGKTNLQWLNYFPWKSMYICNLTSFFCQPTHQIWFTWAVTPSNRYCIQLFFNRFDLFQNVEIYLKLASLRVTV